MITHTRLQQLLPTNFFSQRSINLSSHAIRQIAHVTRSDFFSAGELRPEESCHGRSVLSLLPNASKERDCQEQAGANSPNWQQVASRL